VLIEPEELDALDPKATKTIDIEEFVDLSEIDPIYYDHNYYLAPTAGGAKAYRLLLDAMRDSGKVGIGKVVLRSKQQLAALRPTGDVLTLTTMLWGDEVLPADRLDEIGEIEEASATDRELKMAEQLIAGGRARSDGRARGQPGRCPQRRRGRGAQAAPPARTGQIRRWRRRRQVPEQGKGQDLTRRAPGPGKGERRRVKGPAPPESRMDRGPAFPVRTGNLAPWTPPEAAP
jgi:hypothetical protein